MELPEIVKPDHLSASTINLFISSRSAWYAQKVARTTKFATKPYFQRGKAVEETIKCLLEGATMTTALKKGTEELWSDTTNFSPDDMEKMKGYEVDLEGYASSFMSEINNHRLGDYVGANQKIEIKVKTCSIPIIGYLDFNFENAVVDTKVLGRKCSTLSQGYCIQGLTYFLAMQKTCKFAVMVRTAPKQVATFNTYMLDIREQPDPPVYWKEYLELAAEAIEGVYDCALAGDTFGLMRNMSFPDLSSCFEEGDKVDLLKGWKEGR
jgi:hypothetical protein